MPPYSRPDRKLKLSETVDEGIVKIKHYKAGEWLAGENTKVFCAVRIYLISTAFLMVAVCDFGVYAPTLYFDEFFFKKCNQEAKERGCHWLEIVAGFMNIHTSKGNPGFPVSRLHEELKAELE